MFCKPALPRKRYSFFVFFPLAIIFSLLIARNVFAADDRKVVIPFDFVSNFDDGRYGQMIGDMVWKKISREGGFILPESMDDVRDFCTSHAIHPSPETDMAAMKKIVRDDFDAQIGIWGSVERAPGAEGDVYDIVVKCVDFYSQEEPKIIYEAKGRTKTVSEIPHVYIQQMLDALYERQPGVAPAPDPIIEQNWLNNPNLVIGDFEQGGAGVPKGWDRVCGQQREPLGKLARWTAEEGNASNKVVRFMLDLAVAEFEGVMYYSDYFPVDEGATYRFQCRWRSKGPAVKVFVKCYAEDDSEFRPTSGDAKPRSLKKDDYIPETKLRREVYRSQINLSDGPIDTWTWATRTEDFTPKHVKYTPQWGRVMLYAYLKPGQVEFDDVVVKQIIPASGSEKLKTLKHSKASKVTIEEMKENERRSRQIKEGRKK